MFEILTNDVVTFEQPGSDGNCLENIAAWASDNRV